jgi:hypothetical protein
MIDYINGYEENCNVIIYKLKLSTGDEAGDEGGFGAGSGKTPCLEGFLQLRNLQQCPPKKELTNKPSY